MAGELADKAIETAQNETESKKICESGTKSSGLIHLSLESLQERREKKKPMKSKQPDLSRVTKSVNPQVQEAQRTPNTRNVKKMTLKHITFLKTSDEEHI